MNKHLWRWLVQAFIVCALVIGQSVAWSNESEIQNPIAPPPTSSPRETLTAFLDNTNEAYERIMSAQADTQNAPGLGHPESALAEAQAAEEALERAIETLNLSEIEDAVRDEVGLEMVLKLKEVLDRLELPALSTVPDAEEVAEAELQRWEIPNTEIAIAYVEEGINADEFLFTPGTIERIEAAYQEMQALPYQDGASEGFYKFYISTPGRLLPPKWSNWLPGWSKRLYGEQTLWQWVAFVLTVIIAIAVAWLWQRLLKLAKREQQTARNAILTLLFPLGLLAIVSVSLNIVDGSINLTGSFLRTVLLVGRGVDYILFAWLSFGFFDVIGGLATSLPRFRDQLLEAVIIRNGFRLLGTIAGATAIYAGGIALGIPLAPLLSSLGIGSVAIGFGLQPYVRNIIGGITLFVSQPMKVGDFCEFGGVLGIVEDIGLRATLVRGIDRKLITVPNESVSSAQITNYSRRDKFLLTRTLNLVAESAREKLPAVMDRIREHLANHPLLESERVSLGGLTGGTIDVDLFAYVLTTDYAEFLKVQEDLLLAIQATLDEMEVRQRWLLFKS